jgi:hypothetical protein
MKQPVIVGSAHRQTYDIKTHLSSCSHHGALSQDQAFLTLLTVQSSTLKLEPSVVDETTPTQCN